MRNITQSITSALVILMLVGIAVGYSYTSTGFKAPWFATDDESFNTSVGVGVDANKLITGTLSDARLSSTASNFNESYSYLVYTDGTATYAKNGSTGMVEYSGLSSTVINQAVTHSGKIVLTKGTYEINTPINLVSNLFLTGEGNATVLVAATNLNNNIIQSPGLTGISNVRISSFWIEGNSAGQTIPAAGIWIDANDETPNRDIIIDNIYVNDVYGHGIVVKGTQNLKFHDITTEHNGVTGDSLYNNIYLRRVYSSQIYNIFSNNSVAGVGVRLSNISYNSMTNIISQNNPLYGIHLSRSSSYNYIQGIVLRSGSDGVRLVSEDSLTPSYNNVDIISYLNGGDGLLLAAGYNRISGRYQYNSKSGINTSAAGDKNIISNAYIRGNSQYGINITTGADSNLIVTNYVEANTLGQLSNLGLLTNITANFGI